MRRIRLIISYDGTAYCGSQLQPNGVTIEEKLNEAVSRLTGEPVKTIFASRTDAGVHAAGNVAVFDTEMRMAADKFAIALNQRLPDDIRVRASDEVPPDWHPRKQNCTKTYLYRIWNCRTPDPLRRLYSAFCYYTLDLSRMRRAATCLAGEHDFAAFCSAGSQAENTVRTIYSIDLSEEPRDSAWDRAISKGSAGNGTITVGSAGNSAITAGSAGNGTIAPGSAEGRMITLRISGSGFLYNMVRIIAGTLLEIGEGMRPEEDMKRILASRDRQQAGHVAPASGLTLLSIDFAPRLVPHLEAANDDWSWELDQSETASTGVSRLTIHFCRQPDDYAPLLTRLLHQAHRNGAEEILVRDLERPERLAAGQQYGFYRLMQAEAGPFPLAARDAKR